ncbi:MAG: hypothetical protein WCP36_07515 [Methanomicrobiales archaeon]
MKPHNAVTAFRKLCMDMGRLSTQGELGSFLARVMKDYSPEIYGSR